MNSELAFTVVPWDMEGKNLEKQISLVLKTKLLYFREVLMSNQNGEASPSGMA